MGRGEPLQPEDALTPACELVGGGAAHPPQAGDDDVVGQTPSLSGSAPGSV